MKKIFFVFLLMAVFCFALPAAAFAQSTPQNATVVLAKVLQVVSSGMEPGLPGTAQTTPTQTLKAEIVSGKNNGSVVQFDNDYVQLKAGDEFYLNEIAQSDGTVQYTMNSPYRLNALLVLGAIFFVLVFLIGGFQGIRALASLIGSLLLIAFFLVPGILHGLSPFWVSLGVAGLIIVIGSYITHGWNKTTHIAVAAMAATIMVTGIAAYYAIGATYLTGADENALELVSAGVSINLIGLLFGGIMIGLLGVLYDAAISQAIAVEELREIAPHVSNWHIFKRAMRIGREHIGALVGTLAIAYVGVSLPLILLYTKGAASLLITLNQEIFATEIVRILISSIGLMLAVPITTGLAVLLLKQNTSSVGEAQRISEEKNLEEFHHSH